MKEFLEELNNFKYNLNMSDLENYKFEEKVEIIQRNKEEIENIKTKINDLQEKLKEEKNYKFFESKEVMETQRNKINLLLKDAELKFIRNNSLIDSIKVEIKYANDIKIKELKEKELENAQDQIQSLKTNIESYKQLAEEFDEKVKNEIDTESLENDKKAILCGEKIINALEMENKLLSQDYDKKLNDLIIKSKNGEYNLEQAKKMFNEFRQNLDENFLKNDLTKRQQELEEIGYTKENYKDLIEKLELKLSDENNYLISIFMDELKEKQKEEWNLKLQDSNNQIDFYNNESNKLNNDILEYENIIKLYKEENLEIDKMLRDNNETDKEEILKTRLVSNRTGIAESEECIRELNLILLNNKENLYKLTAKSERISNLLQSMKSKEGVTKNNFKFMLDQKKLHEYKAGIKALENREKYLQTSLMDIVKKIDLISNEENKKNTSTNEFEEKEKQVNLRIEDDPLSITDKIVKELEKSGIKASFDMDEVHQNTSSDKKEAKSEKEEPVTSEIRSVKRSSKEKIKNKLNKVKKAIMVAMTAMIIMTASTKTPTEKIDIAENVPKQEMALEHETTEAVADERLEVNDLITIKEGAAIYKNQYNSYNKENPYNPIYERNLEREVIGISIKMPDGSFKFVQDNDVAKDLLEKGGTVGSYLTGKDNAPEGFWNVDDVIKVQQKENNFEGRMIR